MDVHPEHHYCRDSSGSAGTDWQLTHTCSPWLTASCTSWQLGAGLPESATRIRDAGRNAQAHGSVNLCGRMETTLGMRGGGLCRYGDIVFAKWIQFLYVATLNMWVIVIIRGIIYWMPCKNIYMTFFNALAHCKHILLCIFGRHANTKLWFPSFLKNENRKNVCKIFKFSRSESLFCRSMSNFTSKIEIHTVKKITVIY